MTFIDWFAGAGGFRLGMEQAGHKCIGFCENDKFAVMSYTAMHLASREQMEYIKSLSFKQRQKEILKDEYRNGEWYADDVGRVYSGDIPKADCWCFGFPCQDISIAGKQKGFKGSRSSLFFRIMYLIGQLKEENKPDVLFIENVKNLLSINRGFDFAGLLVCLDENGYDAEWEVLNSKEFGVPHNRERVFIIGHLRGRNRRKIFPVGGTASENHVEQIGNYKATKIRANPNQGRIYGPDGISLCLTKMEGGGLEPHVALKFCDMTAGAGLNTTDTARCLQARYNKGISNRKGEMSGVIIPVSPPCVSSKKQNGRRFKEDGDDMFTLTGYDRHGVAIGGVYTGVSEDFARKPLYGVSRALKASKHDAAVLIRNAENHTVPAMWYEPYGCYVAVRRLTPKECWRLQGWPDEYFEKAAFVNSESQMYKQAGNGVTVPVVKAIGEKLI